MFVPFGYSLKISLIYKDEIKEKFALAKKTKCKKFEHLYQRRGVNLKCLFPK